MKGKTTKGTISVIFVKRNLILLEIDLNMKILSTEI